MKDMGAEPVSMNSSGTAAEVGGCPGLHRAANSPDAVAYVLAGLRVPLNPKDTDIYANTTSTGSSQTTMGAKPGTTRIGSGMIAQENTAVEPVAAMTAVPVDAPHMNGKLSWNHPVGPIVASSPRVCPEARAVDTVFGNCADSHLESDSVFAPPGEDRPRLDPKANPFILLLSPCTCPILDDSAVLANNSVGFGCTDSSSKADVSQHAPFKHALFNEMGSDASDERGYQSNAFLAFCRRYPHEVRRLLLDFSLRSPR